MVTQMRMGTRMMIKLVELGTGTTRMGTRMMIKLVELGTGTTFI